MIYLHNNYNARMTSKHKQKQLFYILRFVFWIKQFANELFSTVIVKIIKTITKQIYI